MTVGALAGPPMHPQAFMCTRTPAFAQVLRVHDASHSYTYTSIIFSVVFAVVGTVVVVVVVDILVAACGVLGTVVKTTYLERAYECKHIVWTC